MWCMKCNLPVPQCTCPDIEERLRAVAQGPAGPAVRSNLEARSSQKIAAAIRGLADKGEVPNLERDIFYKLTATEQASLLDLLTKVWK